MSPRRLPGAGLIVRFQPAACVARTKQEDSFRPKPPSGAADLDNTVTKKKKGGH